MNEIRSHRDLEAWRVAMQVVLETYKLSTDFPRTETYGLTAQMRRAAVSVPSNIAEGQARTIRGALNHFGIGLGSLAELDTQLEVALRLGYVSADRTADLQKLIVSGRRLLHGLRRAKRRSLALSLGGASSLLFLAFRLIA
jgi:four helix bundle protein